MKELDEAIKNKAFGVLDISKSIRVNRQVVYLKDVLDVFADFQKNHVIKSRKQLEEFLTFLYSQVPLFCTQGKNELDCMKSNSPCKRKHRKECPVYLRIMKAKELFEG